MASFSPVFQNLKSNPAIPAAAVTAAAGTAAAIVTPANQEAPRHRAPAMANQEAPRHPAPMIAAVGERWDKWWWGVVVVLARGR